MPVILAGFYVVKMDSHNILNWEITSSANAEYFEILAGNESNGLKIIGRVMATATDIKYGFADARPVAGIQYYQLRITERNGDPDFSKIIAVNNAAGDINLISILPTVVTDNANLIINSAERSRLQLIIAGMDGKIMKRVFYYAEHGRNIFPVDVSNLSSGVYMAKILSDKGQTAMVRFIKE